MGYDINIKNELSESELQDVLLFVNHHIGDFALWCEHRYGEGYELVDRLRIIAEDVEISN